MKKISLIIILALALLIIPAAVTHGGSQTAYATECYRSSQCTKKQICVNGICIAPAKDLKNIKFPLGKYLTLEGDDQKQAYFKEGSPIVNFILDVINFAVRIIGTLAMILLIIGGFMMMFAQGNQQKLDEAKDVVKYAVIGLIVTFLSYIIVIFVQSLFITSEQEFAATSGVWTARSYQTKQPEINI